MRYSSRTRPVPWFTMLVMRPLRRPIFSVTTPTNSSGQSITSFSIGSGRARVLEVGDGLADVHHLEAGERHDVAGAGLLHLDALQPFERVEVRDSRPRGASVEPAQRNVLARAHAAVHDAPDREAADEIRVI